MATKPVENLVYEFLAENAAVFGAGVELHPSAYEERKKDSGIVVGDADTSMLPGNGDEMTEFDALLVIEIYGRLKGSDKVVSRSAARQVVFDLKLKLLQLFESQPSLNGRGCRVSVRRQVRFFDDTRSDKYAIERVPIVLNQKELRGE